jgi:hypothetical protein
MGDNRVPPFSPVDFYQEIALHTHCSLYAWARSGGHRPEDPHNKNPDR